MHGTSSSAISRTALLAVLGTLVVAMVSSACPGTRQGGRTTPDVGPGIPISDGDPGPGPEQGAPPADGPEQGAPPADGPVPPDGPEPPPDAPAPDIEPSCTPDCANKCAGAPSGCPGTTCPTNNCTGCCDASKTCQPGTAKGACGAGGVACTSCGSSQLCQGGGCCNNSCSGKCGGQTNGCGNPCNDPCPCTPSCPASACGKSDGCGGTCPACPCAAQCGTDCCEALTCGSVAYWMNYGNDALCDNGNGACAGKGGVRSSDCPVACCDGGPN